MAVPAETDASFGWYALAKARLLIEKERWDEALETGVESVVFESRSMDSFPMALAFTGTCYERLEEWHRARDVYFALGRLFRQTAWELYAMGRLKQILDEKRTDAEEPQAVQQVFFSGREDLNREASDLVETFVQRQQQGK